MLANFYAHTTLAIATVCTVNANNLLPYMQCTLANFFSTACAAYASNWLPYAQCALAICYRMRSVG